MDGGVSDGLRDALERLDQAIDLLETCVSDKLACVSDKPEGIAGQAEPSLPVGAGTAVLAQRLDRVIERIESALAE
jgi:hypothetical protein